MKKGIMVIVVVVAVLILGYPCALLAEDKPIKLTYANFFPSQHFITQSTNAWAKEIQKRTGGQVKITLFPGSSLLTADKIYEGIVKDTCDIGLTCLAYTRGRFPLMEILDMPLGYANAKVVYRVMWDIYKKFKPKELSDVKMLYIVSHEPGLIGFRSGRVDTLNAIEGKKIRGTGTSAEIIKALGGSPVAMTMGNTYMALSKGVVDGTSGAFNLLKAYKLAEVTQSSTYHPKVGYTTVMPIAMNLEKWNSLPDHVQKVFEEVSEQWVDKTALIQHMKAQEGYDYAKSLGHNFVFLEDNPEEAARWVSRVEGIIGKYKNKMRKQGLPGDAVVKEAQKLIDEYNNSEKYGGPSIIR
jgi:TRAP-type transport system periplasmic protein